MQLGSGLKGGSTLLPAAPSPPDPHPSRPHHLPRPIAGLLAKKPRPESNKPVTITILPCVLGKACGGPEDKY